MKHLARKRFGQHFLNDPSVIDGIVRAIAPAASDAMVEIGPGLAALTQPLVERVGRLTVIELDRDLASKLRAHPQLNVVESDVLKVDFTALAEYLYTMTANHRRVTQDDMRVPPESRPTQHMARQGSRIRVVGNLPYNISSPILFHLLDHVAVVQDQHFMLQKEVIDRMVAQPATSDYGRLSVMLQWRNAMENVLFVPPECFDPPPQVDSAVVRMVPLASPPTIDFKTYGDLVQTAFSQRRKILRNTLGRWLDEHHFSGDFDLQRRAEEVPVYEYVALTLAVQ